MSDTESIRSEILAQSRNPRRCRDRVATPGPVRRFLVEKTATGIENRMTNNFEEKVTDWLAYCQV